MEISNVDGKRERHSDVYNRDQTAYNARSNPFSNNGKDRSQFFHHRNSSAKGPRAPSKNKINASGNPRD